MALIGDEQAREPYCYLETVGRVTGRRRRVELWFAAAGDTLYFLAGGGEATHWVRNLDHQPEARVRVGGTTLPAAGRRIAGQPEEPTARRLLAAKYQGWREGRPLSTWARDSLPIALDLRSPAVADGAREGRLPPDRDSG